MSCPSASLAVWTAAWLHGSAAADDVLDALQPWGLRHEIVAADDEAAEALELPMDGESPATPVQLLGSLRRCGTVGARLVIPVAGDVRGLGGKSEFASAALRAGEAALLTGTRFGVVPRVVADQVLRWTVFALGTAPVLEHVGLGEAEHELSEALRTSAGTLQSLEVARGRPGVRQELRDRLAKLPELEWPAGMPQRALRVLQRASEVDTILALAAEDEPGGALSSSAASQRADALRPLDTAVRTARRAAVNEAARAFSDHADQH
ncbi:MAG: hypothetical protein GEU98_09490 [Pseudonocardiaceae bacterium]|nr:hypothetical protein [Pseudonocardiaceae bacterium]